MALKQERVSPKDNFGGSSFFYRNIIHSLRALLLRRSNLRFSRKLFLIKILRVRAHSVIAKHCNLIGHSKTLKNTYNAKPDRQTNQLYNFVSAPI